MTKGKGLIRATNRRGTSDKKTVGAETRAGSGLEPRICLSCGSMFSRRVWRNDRKVTNALLSRAKWVTCPACTQTSRGEYLGRILIRGAYAREHEDDIRRRIKNVEAMARFTQPQRRVVSAERDGTSFEVLTTSQKLAHRIANELRKAFRGRVRYDWSDEGCLFAVWERD